MNLANLTPSLLYALLSLNPNAVTTLAGLPSSNTPESTPLRQEISAPSMPDSSISATTLVNATVTCRDGEFQNPEDDIAAVVCGDYYKCTDGAEAEQLDPDGQGGEISVWSATCLGCVGGQASNKASGCVWQEIAVT